jgi:hypothetical protein
MIRSVFFLRADLQTTLGDFFKGSSSRDFLQMECQR